jgi:putative nucleotidyltransferase with HDIG domain
MRLVSTDDVVFRRVADLIRLDTAFSAEVLRVANSPLLGCREEVHGILHALAILGLDRMKGIVMTVALRNFLAEALKVPVLQRCWRHSLACALVCEEIAVASLLDKDRCYTAGLLHDMGRLSLLAAYPEDYASLLEAADSDGNETSDLIEAERELFDADHCEIGRWLAADWGFPEDFQAVIEEHHAPTQPDHFDLTALVQLACRFADILGFQAAGAAPLVSIDELKSVFPGCRWDHMKPEADLLVAVAGKLNALECSLFAS